MNDMLNGRRMSARLLLPSLAAALASLSCIGNLIPKAESYELIPTSFDVAGTHPHMVLAEARFTVQGRLALENRTLRMVFPDDALRDALADSIRDSRVFSLVTVYEDAPYRLTVEVPGWGMTEPDVPRIALTVVPAAALLSKEVMVVESLWTLSRSDGSVVARQRIQGRAEGRLLAAQAAVEEGVRDCLAQGMTWLSMVDLGEPQEVAAPPTEAATESERTQE